MILPIQQLYIDTVVFPVSGRVMSYKHFSYIPQYISYFFPSLVFPSSNAKYFHIERFAIGPEVTSAAAALFIFNISTSTTFTCSAAVQRLSVCLPVYITAVTVVYQPEQVVAPSVLAHVVKTVLLPDSFFGIPFIYNEIF